MTSVSAGHIMLTPVEEGREKGWGGGGGLKKREKEEGGEIDK